MRQAQAVRDNLRLKADASNLAAFLRYLREQYSESYERIVDTVCMAAPFFGDFVYRKDLGERLELEWFEANDPDTVHGPRQLSDGTLRFICLATLLLQPAELQPMTNPHRRTRAWAASVRGEPARCSTATGKRRKATHRIDPIGRSDQCLGPRGRDRGQPRTGRVEV